MNGIIFCQRYTKSCFIARPLFDLKLVSSYRHFVLRYLKFYKDLIQNFCVQFNTILIPLKYVFLQGQGEVNIQGIIVFVGKHISIGRGRLTAKLYICVQVCVCVISNIYSSPLPTSHTMGYCTILVTYQNILI